MKGKLLIHKKVFGALFFSLLLALCVNTALYAQASEGDMVRVETVDGNTFTGTLLSEDDEKVLLDVEGVGEVSVDKSRIRSITVLDPDRFRNGQYWEENPQSTRYFYAPNAFGLKKGKGYYQNAWIFFNNVNYGVTDNFSIGGGTVPLFLFGAGTTPVWLSPKVSLPLGTEKFRVAAGGLFATAIGSDGGTAGIFYGNATYGSTDRNATLGLGYGFADGEVSSSPLVNLSGIYRVGFRSYLLTEIYFVPNIEGSGVGLFGYRWAPENFAVDFGLLSPLSDTGGFIGIPWLGVSIPFGN